MSKSEIEAKIEFQETKGKGQMNTYLLKGMVNKAARDSVAQPIITLP